MAVAVEVVDKHELELREHSETIRREHEQVVAHGLAVIEHAIRAGDALIAAKAIIPPGQFRDWMDREVLSVPMCRAYMRIARHKDIVQFQQPATISMALQLLRGADTIDEIPGSVQAEVRRMRSAGATWREITEELGVSEKRARRIWDPEGAKRLARDQQRSTIKARIERRTAERMALSKKAGGGYSDGYSQLRRLMQLIDGLARTAPEQEVRKNMTLAMSSMNTVEDHFVRAMKLVR
jgi:hypothetical protein